MRIAITGISTSAQRLKGYECIPFAAIAAGVTPATGARDREAYILVETELLAGHNLSDWLQDQVLSCPHLFPPNLLPASQD
jgi:hypothetical protein